MTTATFASIPAAPRNSVRDLIDRRTHLHQIAICVFAVAFLATYTRLVCPFIEDLPLTELLFNLTVMLIIHLGIREVAFRRFAEAPDGRSLPRHGYLLSVRTWMITGVVAGALHALRYDFPIPSHVKLLSAYWLLGAGLLAQWEYVLLEGRARAQAIRYVHAERYLESLSRRVMEGFVLFTLAPSLAMALTVGRYQWEGLVDWGMVIEISFLGGLCVLISIGVALRFGSALREDARSIATGTQRIRDGGTGIVLDATRLDEIGEVASGINTMCRELERRQLVLERQLAEKDAMSRISLAMSSLMDADHVLDLIVENSRRVCDAEASSLLLLEEDGEHLRFHVTQGTAAEELRAARVPVGKGIAGHVAQTGEPILIPDAYADERFDASHDRRTGFRTRSILTVPMRTKDRIVGVVQVINRKDGEPFGDEQRLLLESFASQAAVSLDNARLFDETVRMAEDLRIALENERNLTIEKEKMGAYIPKNVVDEISRNREEKLALGGRTIETTMLFSDIKGFTALSETLDPQEIVAFLNVYMTAMTEVIEAEGGIVDKYMGDGIMAIFTEQSAGEHAIAAVRAGVRMQARLAVMRDGDATLRGLQMRIGINTGEVVAGNIGSQTRMDYTVIGDNVNVASRIEGAAPPDGVLVADSTWRSARSEFEATRQEPIAVKNRREPVQTWRIDGARSTGAAAPG